MGGSTVWAARLAMLSALIGAGCGSSDRSLLDPSLSAALEPAFGDRPDAVPADQPGLSSGYKAQVNLQNIVHLADIDHHGLFIDFGTPAEAKYTDGGWNSGWGSQGVDGDATFSYVAANGRVVFPLQGAGPFTLRLRLRALAPQTLQPILNGEALPPIKLDKLDGFADYDVEVAAGKGHAGENQLRLRFGATRRIGDEQVAVALDSIRIIPPVIAADGGTVPESFSAAFEALPIYGALIQPLAVDGHKRRAITVSAPTTLRYHFEVPPAAKLSLRIGSPDGKSGMARARVRITPDGGPTKVLWQRVLTGRWAEPVLSLDRWAGQVVELELSGLGQGVIGFGSPAILVPNAAPPPAPPAKSAILLAVDSLRADRLRAYNSNTSVSTPAFDRVASEALVFDGAQAIDGATKPALASLLTSLDPTSHGVKTADARLADDALLVSEAFKRAGFATAAFVSNGYLAKQFGFDQGWDAYENYVRDDKSRNADALFHAAAGWIEAHQHERFFLFVQTSEPSAPYDPPAELVAKYDSDAYTGPVEPRQTAALIERLTARPPTSSLADRDRHRLEALYDAAIGDVDRHFAELIERLKKLGLYDQTAVVVVGDHGEEFDDHGGYGHARSIYQEILQVPLIARLPTVRARHVDGTVSILDVAPTILAAAGLPVPASMEGVERIADARGAAPSVSAPNIAFSALLQRQPVIRAGRWKLVVGESTARLFDLQSDPHEQLALDPNDHPIALRYCRISLGQFLGSRDRGDWLSAEPKGKSIELNSQAVEIDPATRAKLSALGGE